ncbi:MAG: hypothetical protein ACP6IS_12485 [Candidatus Asgardarchaeia archaeon]
MKEFFRRGDWSLNAGMSFENIGGSIGYEPIHGFEIHGIIANSWDDTFHRRFSPKIGIGFTFK